MTQPEAAQPTLDALVPPDMAPKAGTIGVVKMDLDAPSLFALAVLAGAFIALGAIFATTVTAGAGILPFGVTEVLGGIAFCLGLILVIGAGTELFTGNNLIVMAGGRREGIDVGGVDLVGLVYWFIYRRPQGATRD